jgi:YggT family protein
VPESLVLLDRALAVLRVLVFAIAAGAFLLFAADWLVRTRRINPFGRLARTIRRVSDPLIRPIENRVVRAGGLPSRAPWWALAALVVGGILLLTALGFLRNQLAMLLVAGQRGGSAIAYLLITWSIGLLQLALIVRVIASWLRLSEYRPWIRWSVILTEWFLGPLRRALPTIGVVDISPLVAYFVLVLVRMLLLGFL